MGPGRETKETEESLNNWSQKEKTWRTKLISQADVDGARSDLYWELKLTVELSVVAYLYAKGQRVGNRRTL